MYREEIQGRNTIKTTRNRITVISVAFLLFLSLLIYNLFNLSYVNYAYYKDKVYEQITTSAKLKAKRGSIYDANMNLLATDKTTYRIFASPREIRKQTKADSVDYADVISSKLPAIIDSDYKTLYSKLSNSAVLDVTLKKNAEEEEYKKILALIEEHSLDGMLLTEAQSSRYYPEGTLASHVLGFVGSDLQGLYGLEYYYDKTLSGKDGYYLYGKDANGNILPTEYSTYTNPEDGYSIVTTIDSYLQGELEAVLEEIRLKHGVENRVTGIAMDYTSGAVLAMATTSAFDPNSPYELDALSKLKLENSGFTKDSEEYKAYKKELLEVMWSNKAVSETYEPGSTFKIVTVASALDGGAVSTSDTFSCHGYLAVGGWHIRCHKNKGHGSGFSLAYGLQMSCNPCMMTVAQRLGSDAFYDYVERFGYFEKTGIDLPSEASTIFHEKENIGTTELATASFGQRFKVSIIRQLTSICAVANGGKLVTPYLVDKVINSDGKIISEHKTETKAQVVSAEVAKCVSEILEEGVSGDGGAKNAAVSGYEIAGKTGTSQKFDILDENGNSYLRIGSTVAYSISDKGGIAVIIVVDEPTSYVKYGSVVAAPYVSVFLTKALPYLNYESSAKESTVTVPNLVGLAKDAATRKLSELNITYEVIGNGEVIIGQTPFAEEIIPQGGRMILYTEGGAEAYAEVPNVVGMELSAANLLLTNRGFIVNYSSAAVAGGGATVTSQSLAAGAVVPKNSVIYIEAIHLDFED